MVSAVKGLDLQYMATVWPGSAHSASWPPMYSNPDVYRWLLDHSLNSCAKVLRAG